jgi:hypothetical protein
MFGLDKVFKGALNLFGGGLGGGLLSGFLPTLIGGMFKKDIPKPRAMPPPPVNMVKRKGVSGAIDADKKRRQRSLMGRAGNIAGGSLGGSTESAQGYSGTTLGG